MIRYCLVSFFISIAVLAGIDDTKAAGTEDARQFVDNVGKKVLEVVDGKGTESQKKQQLQRLFSEKVDMDWMGRFVLGHGWALATEDQHNRYLQAYREYLLARYTTNFADYAGSKYIITGVNNEADGQFIVSMEIKSPHAKEQETEAGYRVRATENGQYKIIDIIIEGVSLITTQRSEFAAVVQKDGMDKLIEQLKMKTQTKAL